MNGTKTQLESGVAGPIHDRIGPIFDTAFIKLIPNDILKEITLIRAKALHNTIRAELGAADEVIKAIEKVRF